MNDIAEPLRPARILVKSKKFPPLRDFSCGRKGNPWETTINKWARSLYLGTETETQTVMVVEDANGKLIGVCSYIPFPFDVPDGKLFDNALRIHMIGTDRLFHGKRLEDGSRPGDAVLSGALDHIKTAFDDRLPYMTTLVDPENDRSQALFERHGFSALPYADEGDLILVRPPRKQQASFPLRLFAKGTRRRAVGEAG